MLTGSQSQSRLPVKILRDLFCLGFISPSRASVSLSEGRNMNGHELFYFIVGKNILGRVC